MQLLRDNIKKLDLGLITTATNKGGFTISIKNFDYKINARNKTDVKNARKTLSKWRKNVHEILNKILLDIPDGDKIFGVRKVTHCISTYICKLCGVDMGKLYHTNYCEYDYESSKCWCYRCPKRNDYKNHKSTYLKLYGGIEVSKKTPSKLERFVPENTAEFKLAVLIKLVYNRGKKNPSESTIFNVLPKDVMYIILNMIMESVRIRNGKIYRWRSK
jgi:hypothetical protein